MPEKPSRVPKRRSPPSSCAQLSLLLRLLSRLPQIVEHYLANFIFPQIEKESGAPLPGWVTENVPDWLLPWSVFSAGPPPEPEED